MLTVFYYVKICATIISIIVPILLMYNKLIKILSKHVLSGEPLSEDLGNVIKKLIAALVIFLIPSIVNNFF